MSLLTQAIAAPFRLWNHVSDEVLKQRRLTLRDGDAWSAFFGQGSTSGKIVTLTTAMKLDTVWACVRASSTAASSLPLNLFERQTDKSSEEVDDTTADVFNVKANLDQTALEFWELQIARLLTSGNAMSEISARTGRLDALQPLPETTRPRRNSDGDLIYVFTERGKTEELPREKVFHLKGFGQGLGVTNLDWGMSPVNVGANTLGNAMAAEESAGKMFANGLAASGALSSDRVLKDAQRAQLQKMLESYTGSDRAGKTLILEAGLKYQQMMLNPDDAQLLETRNFAVEQICRWFGMPPIVIGHSPQGQTMWGSGVEQILLAWLALGIDPLCDRIEARINAFLLQPLGRRKQFVRFNREALLQMDSKAKAEFLSKMIQNGLMDRNEARTEHLNLPTREGADELTAQVNMAPLDKLGQMENRSAQ
jgi:HK97 family phage portal protein